MRTISIFLLTFVLPFSMAAPTSESNSRVKKAEQLEKEISLVDFNSIKSVLKKDNLNQIVKEKKKEIIVVKQEQKKKKVVLYNYPQEVDFWTFCSELWLVRNAQLLKWDFKKPDYGLSISFRTLLESLGYYEKRFNILLVNTPTLSHIALPTSSNEALLVLSVPFIRTLDLTKLEISLLLLEDYFRLEKGYFYDHVRSTDLQKIFGANFFGKSPQMKIMDKVLNRYSELVFQKGFSFQQQFEVTKRMDSVLRSNLKLWGAYNKLLQKIDNLVKSNLLYNGYNKIYPSPELQLKWLSPSQKNS